jgi:MFS family permease
VRDRGWDTSSVSLATSLYFITSAIAGTAVGRSVDRRGARGWLVAGACVMALALVGIGQVDAPWQLYFAYPVLAVGFAMTGSVPTSAIITRWFVVHRARAMSIAYTGVSVGGVVLVPFTAKLIVDQGIEIATAFLAALVVGVVLPMVLAVLRWSPEPYGLEPDGDSQLAESARHPHLHADVQTRQWGTREALRTSTFWTLVAAFGGILFCQVAAAMHQMALVRDHLDSTGAALAVSTTAMASLVARLVVGSFADRVSKRRLGVTLILLQAGALATFSVASSPFALYAASLAFGFTIGNLFMLQTLMVGELFGLVSFGTVLGLIQLLTQTLSGLGPYALGLVYDATGEYPTGMRLLAGIAVMAALALSRVRPPPAAVAAQATTAS